jgi:hypothetical protein
MPPLLIRYRFNAADIDLPEIQGFACGDARWDREVADWIKSRSGDNSVLEDIQQFGTEVWLYRTESRELVGFASLGHNNWHIPMPRGPRRLINLIPFIGVQQRFQGEPRDAQRDDRFAYQILDDLIELAVEKLPLVATSSRTSACP